MREHYFYEIRATAGGVGLDRPLLVFLMAGMVLENSGSRKLANRCGVVCVRKVQSANYCGNLMILYELLLLR